MTLFESESQYREKATIWRVFSLLPLYGALARGRIWRWFAINIPMDLETGGRFTSDIDILARLSDFPRSQNWIYKTWEVKVSLLCKDGSARSLKSGKLNRTVKQLRAYREFGSADVSLLDIYVCEAGFMNNNVFPPACLHNTIRAKVAELSKEHFGYQLLPFEHGRDGDIDVGLLAISEEGNPLRTTADILDAVNCHSKESFSRLVNHMDEFFENSPDEPKKSFKQIVFCRECDRLQLIRMRKDHTLPWLRYGSGGSVLMCRRFHFIIGVFLHPGNDFLQAFDFGDSFETEPLEVCR